MNYIQIVGRIVEVPEGHSLVGNENYSLLHLEVEQNFKSQAGKIQKDIFPIQLWRGISDEIRHRCTPQQLVAVKGRLEMHSQKYSLIAEHVQIL